MDEQNPAVAAQTRIPPALLEEVGNDPRELERWVRKLYLVNMDKLQRLMKAQDIPISQRMAWLEHLAKYGGLGQAKAAPVAAGSGFSVQIVLNNQNQQPPTAIPQVVEVTAAPVEVNE